MAERSLRDPAHYIVVEFDDGRIIGRGAASAYPDKPVQFGIRAWRTRTAAGRPAGSAFVIYNRTCGKEDRPE